MPPVAVEPLPSRSLSLRREDFMMAHNSCGSASTGRAGTALSAHGNGAEPLAQPGWADLLCPAPAQPCAVPLDSKGEKNKPKPITFHCSSSLQSVSSTRCVWWMTQSQGVPGTVAPPWDLHPPSLSDPAVCSQSLLLWLFLTFHQNHPCSFTSSIP